MMKRAADERSSRKTKEKKLHRSHHVKSPGGEAIDGGTLKVKKNGKSRTTTVGGGGRSAAIVTPAKSLSTSLSNVDSRVDDCDVVNAAKKEGKKSAASSKSKSSKVKKKSPLLASSNSLSSASMALSIDTPKLPAYQIDWLDCGATSRELFKYCKYPVDLPISQEDQLSALLSKFTLTELKTALVVTSCAVGGSAIASCMPNSNARKEHVIKIFLSLIYDHRCMMYDTENQDGYR